MELIGVIPAFFIAAFACLQWFIARQNLRVQLLDKRMEIFSFTEKVRKPAEAARELQNEELQCINELGFMRLRSRFLFGEDVSRWFKDLHMAICDKIDAQDAINSKLRIQDDVEEEMEERNRANKKIRDLFKRRDALFSTYLDFSFIRRR